MLSIFKIKPLYWFILIVAIVFFIIIFIVHGADAARYWFSSHPSSDAYNFPLQPGSEQWKAMISNEDKIETNQIPKDKLEMMTTEGLIETCFNYPHFGDMFLYNTLQKGFDSTAGRFNGLQALMERSDAGTKLLSKYREMDLEKISKSDPYPSLRIGYVEMLLAQDAILSKLTPSERHELLQICIQKGQLKLGTLSESYSYTTTAVLAGRILQIDNPDFALMVQENPALKAFLEHASIATILPEDWDGILHQIQKFIDFE